MKKYLAVLICAVFIFALVPVWSGNHSKAQVQLEINDAEFDESTIMARIKPNMGGIRLFSSEPTLEELGIAEAENLDEPMQSEVSMFSVRNEAAVYKLTLAEPGRENVLETIEKLNELSYVEFAEPNYICTLYSTPNDEFYTKGEQYGLDKVAAPAVWDMDIDCSDVVVAVIDTGALMSHPDLEENIWTNPNEIPNNGIDDDGNGFIDDVHGWDFYNGDKDPTDDDYSKNHGTHVSGTISAVTNNEIGVASLSRSAKILPLKVFNSEGKTTIDYICRAIQYVKKMEIPIVNCSFGFPNKSDIVLTSIEECKNTVFIVASGNSTVNIDTAPVYPASFDCDNIMSVASTDEKDSMSTFSNYGIASVDIAAPGTSIKSTCINGSGYGRLSGTSQASPMVASAAAVIKAKYPDITPQEIIKVLEEGADKLDTLTGKVKTGARLNAYGALEKAALIMATPTPSPSPSPSPTPTAKPTASPSPSPTPTASPSPTPTAKPTASPSPTPSSTPAPMPSPTLSPTPTPTEFSIRYGGSKAVVTAPKKGTYCVIFALYKDNSLVKMEAVKAEFDEAGDKTVPMSIDIYGANRIKVMLWESLDGMRPLCKSD